MITFHDPRGERAVEEDEYTLSHKFRPDGDGTTVALLANGFPDSEGFLDAIGEILQQRLPKLSLKSWNKGNASIPAPDDMLQEIKSSCQIAIAAYGH